MTARVLCYRKVIPIHVFEKDTGQAKRILEEVRLNISRLLANYLMQSDDIFRIYQGQGTYTIEVSITVEKDRLQVSFDPETLPESIYNKISDHD